MSQLTPADVENIANLARLHLTEQEKAMYQEQLSAILDYAAALQHLNTADIPPTTSALPLHTVMRPDQTRPSLSPADALANAPSQADQSFLVKPVL